MECWNQSTLEGHDIQIGGDGKGVVPGEWKPRLRGHTTVLVQPLELEAEWSLWEPDLKQDPSTVEFERADWSERSLLGEEVGWKWWGRNG